jgi:poly(A) polymerase
MIVLQLYASDRNHRMPIITPAYPSMCATHNVSRSTFEVIKQELEKGIQVTEEIMLGKRPWRDLFTKHTFFTDGFKYYLVVIASSLKEENHNLWKGLIESKVRLLVNKIENHSQIVLARPFIKGFERVHRCTTPAQVDEVVCLGSTAYIYKPPANDQDGSKPESKVEAKKDPSPENGASNGVAVKKEQNGDKTADGTTIKREQSAEPPMPPPKDAALKAEDADSKVKLEDVPEKKEPEVYMVYTTNFYIGLQPVEGAKALDLSREVNDWRAMCMNNPQYEPNVRFLAVRNVKNTALPDDVFEPGETRPRPAKKSLKRVASEEPGNGQGPAKKTARTTNNNETKQQPQQQQQSLPQKQPPQSTATAAAG